MTSLQFLAPIILFFGVLGTLLLVVAAWKGRRWSPPQDYRTKYGRLVRRVRRVP